MPPFGGVLPLPDESGVIADGAELADGSGLAANTTATPPVTSRAPAIALVSTARRTPSGRRMCGAVGPEGADDAGGVTSARVSRYPVSSGRVSLCSEGGGHGRSVDESGHQHLAPGIAVGDVTGTG